jgi:hypothetical protein
MIVERLIRNYSKGSDHELVSQYPDICLEKLRRTTKSLIQDSRYLGLDSKANQESYRWSNPLGDSREWRCK